VDVDDAIIEHPLLSAKVKGIGGKLPFRNGAFDLVTANMVVEHVDDCPAFLDDIFRVLAPGGRFIFHTPNYYYCVIKEQFSVELFSWAKRLGQAHRDSALRHISRAWLKPQGTPIGTLR
jgi:ubiquinone/menaquinone biosynthesis C-methylase UbiE